jgi:hypothetical protein
MREAILDLIRAYRNVSFAELSQRIDGFKGDQEWLNSYGWVLWSGISREAIDVLQSMLEAGEVHMAPAHWLVYMFDGAALKLPLVKCARKYKRPHWCPVVFNPGLPKQGRSRVVAP